MLKTSEKRAQTEKTVRHDERIQQNIFFSTKDSICCEPKNYLTAVDWCTLLLDLCIDDCVEKFYIIIRECFVPFYYSVDSENIRQLWFDKRLRNLHNIRTKSHKYMKELGEDMTDDCRFF
jgi:hypothetical protein